MDLIKESINEWLREILISGIMSNLTNMFDNVNEKVEGIGVQVGTTPMEWNSSIFNMIKTLSETVIMPIAALILTFVMCYELIHIVIEKNNMNDVDTWIIFKWIFKTSIAVFIVANTWNITMAVFDMAQAVVNNASGVIVSDTSIDISSVISDLETTLESMETGALVGLWVQSLFVGITMWVLTIIIFLVIYSRMMEIYLTTSLAPIPFATMANREWGTVGQNYLKSLLALAFQGFLIIVCVAIYAVLVRNITITDEIIKSIWTCMGYTILLAYSLLKTSSLSKAIFNAH